MSAMNETSSSPCTVSNYLSLCASSKLLLLVPGFGLNIFILLSLVSSLLGRRSKIKKNVAMFILGSTSCNLVNLSLWPLTIHWQHHGRWLLGARMCDVMVGAKHLTSSASFQYISFITFSIYLTVVCGWGPLVNSRVFLALQLIFPLLPVGLMELIEWIQGSSVDHLDPVNLTCFSFINDEVMRILMMVKTALCLPLSLYFYAHILHTIVLSAKRTQRSQRSNVHLAKVFSLISLITFTAHVPGAVFALMKHTSVCQEMVRDFLLDLPLLSSPVILLCMNKELRNQCLLLLRRNPNSDSVNTKSISNTDEQHNKLNMVETDKIQR
ncbi:hypothetical protein CesoFtcFv8_010345 [Champsocephalus esox]|uniref:G-protein coupled receptors family 1 profile domain-containing protein n=2 Tax=Champsocephalus esox TaxID=159716 RepID=A0AAN8C7B6_9TELE|nr:hypothetical protein CesoFtcFv8_010345 [Champsocephalus esox]